MVKVKGAALKKVSVKKKGGKQKGYSHSETVIIHLSMARKAPHCGTLTSGAW